ncbi:hypothetical protein [Companilactobacillus mishanensis]|uniref:Phage protein n=1 Tax=Companilactobacillus mishanensis TaxID=2486008 RepID=A0A5P0ZGK6_9LACO|nr:hypothetical protein [Companilactobacillus mishanensis]MQS52148.1 hypothetical protein [Companilactobacillus mishanensis]
MDVDTAQFIYEKSVEAAGKKIIEKDGITFFVDRDGDVREWLPENISVKRVQISTLTGVVDLIKNMDERNNEKLFIQINGANRVNVFGAIDQYGRRESLIESIAQLPSIDLDTFQDQENMNIMLQSQFVENDDRALLLKVIGNLKEENVTTASDDGISQAVQIKSGIASVSKVKVPNPVELAPFRTFSEVDQPTSKFVFRMREGMMSAVFEADGGAWKNEAIQNIKDYLSEALSQEIKNNHVVVVA